VCWSVGLNAATLALLRLRCASQVLGCGRVASELHTAAGRSNCQRCTARPALALPRALLPRHVRVTCCWAGE
jgi:hypothetical protein